MKYLLVFVSLQFFIFYNNALQAQWVPTSGPSGTEGKYILKLVACGNIIFAGTNYGGVYHSSDGGATWIPVNNGPVSTYIQALAVNGTNIYACIKKSTSVFCSTDYGSTWTQSYNNGIHTTGIMSFAFIGSNIFVGTQNGVFLSTNGGTDFAQVFQPDSYVSQLAVSDTNIFAGTYDGGIYLTTNQGINWTQVNNGLSNTRVYSLAVNGNYIFAGTNSGLFRSTNNGTDWTEVYNDPVNTHVKTLAVNGNNIFAATDSSGVFLSTNNGTNWLSINDGLLTNNVNSFAVCGKDIYAGTYEAGVWKRPLTELVGISKESNNFPMDYTLSQNYPNPFNPGTVISYSLPIASIVKLIVYNTLGQTVKILENGFKNAANYSINFNAADLPSGIYFYKIETGQFSQIKKMVLLK